MIVRRVQRVNSAVVVFVTIPLDLDAFAQGNLRSMHHDLRLSEFCVGHCFLHGYSSLHHTLDEVAAICI